MVNYFQPIEVDIDTQNRKKKNTNTLGSLENSDESISDTSSDDNKRELIIKNDSELESTDDKEMPLTGGDDDPIPRFEDLLAKENPNTVEQALLSRPNEAKLIFSNYLKIKQKGKRLAKNYVGLISEHKKILCDLIIKEELKSVTQMISSDRFKLLASEIEQLFPKEKASVYYSPHLSIRKNNKIIKKRAARGKLYHKFTNFRKKLKDGGLIQNYSCETSC
ncbi:uncharacterized protein LOC127285127 [Leptopilina boulardi]|uniref:uncharacterized protein LOC127285127 n=1 Tax=Leptopilina boulardi TaxID=63433 RepID=UPI0021F698C7|nr:uncharacterized protein LOC127285127 [Leptopilina boulardi]